MPAGAGHSEIPVTALTNMPADASSILGHLGVVNDERARRQQSPKLAAKVQAIKQYQQRRFSHTYADLLGSVRYGPASRFFLEELYGPRDFTLRDMQFARVVPALVRLFPQEIVDVVNTLAELHALSETLDSRMATHLANTEVEATSYIAAWRTTGGVAERDRQVALTLQVGAALDRLTRKPLLRNSPRRKPGRVTAFPGDRLRHFQGDGRSTGVSFAGARAGRTAGIGAVRCRRG
jgi:hypothetical protein